MSHMDERQWMLYINGELSESMMQEYENHLYSCDHCLGIYMDVLEKEENLPLIESEQEMTDAIMETIAKLPLHKTKEIIQEKKSKKTMLAHYLIAAGFTLLLMASGVFQSLTNYVGFIEQSNVNEKTITDIVVDKTFHWMDSIEKNQKEGLLDE